jgi:hypothetical protein
MKVKWGLLGILFLYVFMIAGNLHGVLHSPRHGVFWISGGASAWIFLMGVWLAMRNWPIIWFPKPETERIPGATYTQPILAWRMWVMNGGKLTSVHYSSQPWKPKQRFSAHCFTCKPLPEPRCTCGVYAKRNIEYSFWVNNQRSSCVLGLVYLWGNIVEGDRGYRAQFAYPAKLFIIDNNEAEIMAIAHKYGIPWQKLTWWQRRKFKNGGTQWISVQYEELSPLNQLSFLSPTEKLQMSRSA